MTQHERGLHHVGGSGPPDMLGGSQTAPGDDESDYQQRKSSATDPSIASTAYAKLRELILCGELTPGEPISQVQLAHAMGVSRTPLREALRKLEREGLIEAPPRRKVSVAPVSPATMDELYGMRIINEALALEVTVPVMSAEDHRFLKSALQSMEEHAAARDLQRWEAWNDAFHERLVSRAGPRIRQQYAELSDYSRRYRRLYARQDASAWAVASAEHEAIVEACLRRDADAAASELARHLSHTALVVLARIAPEYDPVHIRAAVRIIVGRGESATGGHS